MNAVFRLNSNIHLAQAILAGGEASVNQFAERLALLRGTIQQDLGVIERIDFDASVQKSPNKLFAQSVNRALLQTAERANALLKRIPVQAPSRGLDLQTALFATLLAGGLIKYFWPASVYSLATRSVPIPNNGTCPARPFLALGAPYKALPSL